MVECLNGHHRSRLASRRAGDGAHRDIDRRKLEPDRIGGEIVASAARVPCTSLAAEQQDEPGLGSFFYHSDPKYKKHLCIKI